MDQRTHEVMILMNGNCRQELSLAAMAHAVNLSPWRLWHIFKAETGTTPTRHLHKLRMQRATQLLETTFLTIKEIKNLVGLRSESHFATDFRRAYGITPAQYRATSTRVMVSPNDQEMPDSNFGQ